MDIKSVIFGLAVGGCVSGVATYFITKKKTEDRVNTEANQRCEGIILQMRQYYEEQYEIKKAAVIKEEEKDDPSEIVKQYSEYKEIAENLYSHANMDKPWTDTLNKDIAAVKQKYAEREEMLAEMEHPEDDAPDEYYEEVGPDPEETKGVIDGIMADHYDRMNRGKVPEIISEEEFGQAPGFDAEECVYYVEDLTFCDEEENILDNELQMFGPAVEEWKDNHEMTDPICIRNYDLNCDYRIEKMFCQCPGYVKVNDD